MLKTMDAKEARKLDYWLNLYMYRTFYNSGFWSPISQETKDYFWDKSKDNPFEKYINYGEPEKVLASIDENPELEGKKIKGYVELISFYVARNHSGKHLGTLLLKELQKKYKKIFLGVYSGNKHAIEVYKHLGFKRACTINWEYDTPERNRVIDHYYVMAYSEDGDISDLIKQIK